MTRFLFALAILASLVTVVAAAEDLAIPARASGVSIGQPALPTLTLEPLGARGRQLLRFSLPCAPGALLDGQGVVAHLPGKSVRAAVRVLSAYPGIPRCARRALLTLPLELNSDAPMSLRLEATDVPSEESPLRVAEDGQSAAVPWPTYALAVNANEIIYRVGEREIHLETAGLAPLGSAVRIEAVEATAHYVWLRMHAGAPPGKRVVEVRADSLGTVALSVQIQRAEKGDGYAPAFGWRATGTHFVAPATERPAAVLDAAGALQFSFPTLEAYARGRVQLDAEGALVYWRCTPEEQVPLQEGAWRSAEMVLGNPEYTPRNPLLEPLLAVSVPSTAYAPLYGTNATLDLAPWPALAALDAYTRDALPRSASQGDDAFNVTGFNPGSEHGGVFGMNRLNHAPEMLFWDWRNGGRTGRDTAVRWCLNMHDLSIWWGEGEPHGGTRYNNAVAAGQKEHEGDQTFMWRTNDASTFCTKGFDTFLYAYEETGDPRFAEALHAQVAYAKQHVRVNTGEARNIGDVKDFLSLYRATGQQEYLDEALRLFRELREVLSTGDLFSQNCKPLVPDPPFIDDDAFGYEHPFAKPYIIGYALAGLPDLLRLAPEEPKLRDVVRAVADFLAESVDPSGGWRYPHPKSSSVIISQGMEHAMQLCNAARVLEERGEHIDNLLDAVETVLQARVMGYLHSGAILGGLTGWERSTGALPEGKSLHDLYQKPGDRDMARDYTEGSVGVGGSSPEGLVYFDAVLRFYLAHRPAERLFHANPQLQEMLDRVPHTPPPSVAAQAGLRSSALPFGMKDGRPSFADAQIERMNFPLRFTHSGLDFAAWRDAARGAFLASLQAAPPRVAFNAEVLTTEDRGTHEARKLLLNLSADYRVPAYLLVPKGAQRAPAVLAMHDHGAHFSIGKEKVVRPFGVDAAVLADAQEWVNRYYGGQWIGDVLAARGYVVLAVDALFWGERGRAEGPEYTAQETLAVNLAQLGRSWAGSIVWDDVRSAEFLQSLPEVDPARIGATGLSMGAHRTWALAAATDIVQAGAAICWLGDTPALLAAGNNQTRGQSAHAMTFPGLRSALDFADVASIACPKPMLFYNGTEDPLFPVPGVERSYALLHEVYATQPGAGPLETRLWPVPHLFNEAMQDAAFAWLDVQLKP